MCVRGVLLDIEGTTSSIDFVYQEMFPFVRRELEVFLTDNWEREDVSAACHQIASDAGHASLSDLAAGESDREQTAVTIEVLRLMDGDAKTTGLKQLQGLIWKSGFESGELRAHLFEDVARALKQWRESGLEIRIYSSGSVAAQKLFFGHTIEGDLLPLMAAHYDTTTGHKRDAASYAAIAQHWELPPSDILFLSDVQEELDAAVAAGMQTRLCERPGNKPTTAPLDHQVIRSFSELELESKTAA